MPLPKQTTDLTLALQALIYRIRQLIRERRGYSKAKARELAKLLKDGREDFARIKTEEVIANDNLIAALEIIELHCEQLHVRVNILDHIAFGQNRKGKAPAVRRRGNHPGSGRVAPGPAAGEGKSGNGGWGLWKFLGLGAGSQGQAPDDAGRQPTEDPGLAKHNVGDGVVKGGDQTHKELELEPEPEPEPEVFIEPELDRAAAVIFYSYPRLPRDIAGLPELRVKLIQRWGNDFASRVQDDDEPPVELPEELVERLRVQRASPVLVEKYLKEIARSHGIRWHQDEDEDDGDDDDQGQAVENNQLPEIAGKDPASRADAQAADDRGKRSPPGDVKGVETPSSTAADILPLESRTSEPHESTVGGGIPEVDELAKRFAALKR
ncbi:predicted protein [Uncinocarpus reesii 1704]|uniref:DUF292 domain-containing protein n=1 Tax=Uncinocarpus reesii (strain UAMH 1704) TaxID=336963 RepID=C4JYE5_UNCRE|nr:uncharacterized protein UREG_07196 [Uncinocarpus reesii 1704]EEP82331.1 predicted protein [Uncinocarpus reesii 1704]